jgi:hypothetical protein
MVGFFTRADIAYISCNHRDAFDDALMSGQMKS